MGDVKVTINNFKVGDNNILYYYDLFRYAHFIYDCVITELSSDLSAYTTVYRKKDIKQTIGNFTSLYEEILQRKNIEVSEEEYAALPCPEYVLTPPLHESITKKHIETFRHHIFNRYSIDESAIDPMYPEILLIERGSIPLVSDSLLVNQLDQCILMNKNGKELREIFEIENLKTQLQLFYAERFKTVILEGMPFEEQVRHFVNASVVIGCHGAGMINVMFCKAYTIVIECGDTTPRFTKVCKELNLKRYLLLNNKYIPSRVLDILSKSI
jgi:hypothetical protein